ncbi:MAG: TldD/PmbA family protein [Microcoleaceae cyanobacterium]
MDNSALQQLLNLAAQKADAAEVYSLDTQDTPIEFENNHLKSLQTKGTQGLALRLIHNGKLGFASSTDLTRLEDLVDAALQTAEIGATAEFEFATDFHLKSGGSDYTPPSTSEFVQMGQDLIEQVHQYNSDIMVGATFHIRRKNIAIATTRGVEAQRSSQTISGSLSGNLVRGEDFLEIYSYDVVGDRPLNADHLLQQLLEKYRNAEQSATIQTGSYPVLFTPQAVALIFGGLFKTVLSGQSVIQQASPLANKLGETLFDKRFSLFEDPNLGVNACAFDDEGTPTTRKHLIEQGTVQGFYWDRQCGAKAEAKLGGNGFRGGLSRPTPSLVNLCIAPGESSMADLIANIDQGLIVDQVLGAGQSNQLAGEFSVNLDLGYKVENGKIVGRLKNTMVAGSIFEAFQQMVDLGSQPQWFGSSAFVPCILFQQLGVTARQS